LNFFYRKKKISIKNKEKCCVVKIRLRTFAAPFERKGRIRKKFFTY